MAGRAREQLGSAPYRRRLKIETLEDRRLLTVSTVVSPAANNSNNTVLTAAPAQGAGANVPPVLAVVLDKQVNEGELLDFSGTGGAPPLDLYVDPDLGDTHTATIDWGDGTPLQNATIFAGPGSGAIGGTHVYADDGNYTATVHVADNNGGSATQTFHVLVKNVPPVIVPSSNQTMNEGHLLDLSNSGGAPALGLFVDLGFDNPLNPNGPVLPNIADPLHESFTYDVDWGDGVGAVRGASIADINGGPGVLSSGTLAGTHIYADDGTYTVTLTVHDDNGGVVSGQFTVTVKNVAPFVDLTGPTSVNEGLPNSWNLGSIVDPGTDTVTQYIIHWGDGNTDTFTATQIAAMSKTIGHVYVEGPNNYTIAVDLVDEDGTYSSVDTLNVTVKNVVPTVALNAVQPISEFGFATLSGSYTDIGLLDNHTVTVDWDDPNNGLHSVFQVPSILGGPLVTTTFNSTTLGDTTTVLIVTAIDNAIGQVSFSVQHQYLDDGVAPNNNFTASDTSTILVTVADDDAQSGNANATVTVNNVPATVALNTVPAIAANGVATLSGTYSDIGLLDSHTLTIDWDDPNTTLDSTFVVSAIQNAAGAAGLLVGSIFNSSTDSAMLKIVSINTSVGGVDFAVQHQYAGARLASTTRTIGVTIIDDDAQGSGASATVMVVAPPTLIGDYNRDGVVDAADFVVFRITLGSSVPIYSGADSNGDGIVNQADYDAWRANFGLTGRPGSGASVEGPVESGERLAGRTALDEPVAAAETVRPMIAFDTVEPTRNLSQRISRQARRLSMAEVKNRDDVLQALLGSHEAGRWEEIGEMHRASDRQELPSYGDAIDVAIDTLNVNVWQRPSLKRSRY